MAERRRSFLDTLELFYESHGWSDIDQAADSEEPTPATADDLTWSLFMDSFASALDTHHGVNSQ